MEEKRIILLLLKALLNWKNIGVKMNLFFAFRLEKSSCAKTSVQTGWKKVEKKLAYKEVLLVYLGFIKA